MRKKWLVAVAVVALLAAFAAVAFAEKPIQLVVNGRVIETDVQPQLVDGRVMVPVRWVAEALGARVKWEGEKRNVVIDTPESASLQRRVKLLQEAAAPATPKEAVEKWAKGVKERNGALQYAVLSPELKEQRLSHYESCGWVTGTSSPWVEYFEIVKETKTGDGEWEYEVKFTFAASTGPAGSSVTRAVVKEYKDPKQCWYISQLFNEDNLTGQLKKQATDFLLQKYGRHYDVKEIDVSLLSCRVAGAQAEAEFKTRVTHVLGCKTPEEWPPQKGRIQYLEENRNSLSPEKIRKIEEKIAFWNKELQEYIDKPSETNEFLKLTAEFDSGGMIKGDTVKIYYQDPMGQYLPVKEEDWPAFKSAEKLIKQGYEEMRQLVEQ